MSKTMRNVCPHCGGLVAKYPHFLSKTLALALAKIHNYGQANITRIDLTHTQINNFGKLRYWGLVERVHDQAGWWRITPAGRDFLSGRLQVYRCVWTFRNERERFDGELITIHDVLPGYATRKDFAVSRENVEQPPAWKDGKLF